MSEKPETQAQKSSEQTYVDRDEFVKNYSINPETIKKLEDDNNKVTQILKNYTKIEELNLYKQKYFDFFKIFKEQQNTIENYAKKYKSNNQTLTNINSEINKKEDIIRSYEENINDSKDKIKELQEKITIEGQKYQETQKEIAEQKNSFIELEQCKNQKIKKAEEEQKLILSEYQKEYEVILKRKEVLEQQLQEFSEETSYIDNQHKVKQEQNSELSKQKEAIEQKIQDFNQLIEEAKNDQGKLEIQINDIQAQQKEVTARLEEQDEILRQKKEEYEKLPQEKDKLQKQKDELSRKIKEEERKLKMIDKQNKDSLEKQDKINLDNEENQKLNEQLKLQVQDLERQNNRLVKDYIALQKMINQEKNKRDDLQKELEQLINMDKINQQDLDNIRKLKDKRQEDINSYQRLKRNVDKELKDVQDRDHNVGGDIIQQLNRQRKLQNQINAYKHETDRLRNVITQLQKEQEKYGIEASQAHAKYYQTIEEVKIKNSQITELQKKNAEVEAKLKHQQNLYEAVRSDRNLYSKNLLESQDEIDELQKKYTRMTHQVDQFKEEIKQKDAQLVKEDFEFNKIVEDNKTTKLQKKRIKKAITSTEEVIKSQEQHVSRLKYVIQEAKQEKQRNSKDLDMVINERDILGTQLIKRNQELNVLYEKIKLSQSNLAKGEIFFRERQKELDSLKDELTLLINELKATNFQTSYTDDLKKEINKLDKDILQAKTRVKALGDELENPLNIHRQAYLFELNNINQLILQTIRWRKLEATDQELFEKILKIQTLQRRLIAKTEEVKEKENLIKEKEKLFMELKNILARQPGQEIHQQLAQYQQTLKEKQANMKKMNGQLAQAIESVDLLKFENNRLRDELGKMKQDYFKKRREQERQAKYNNYMDINEQDEFQNQAGGIIYDQYNPNHNPDLKQQQNQNPAPM